MRMKPEDKIMTLSDAVKARKDHVLVITNGCFDIIHKGHVECLNEAKQLGDKLYVLLNSDESVKKLKGEDRPINKQEDRAYVLASLEAVDGVIIFNETNCSEELMMLRPNYYVKGGDYTGNLEKHERMVLDTFKCRIKILNFVEGYSTTNLINKMKGII